jgi:hypothetical protein
VSADDQWHRLKVYFKRSSDNGFTANDGVILVWLDDVQIFSKTTSDLFVNVFTGTEGHLNFVTHGRYGLLPTTNFRMFVLSGTLGSTHFGAFGTVTSTLTFLANLDGTTRTVHEPNTFVIAGKLLVLGDTTFGGLKLRRTPAVTITDAQVKALPTTPITLLADPGAGLIAVPVMVALFSKIITPYTNVNADGYLWAEWSNGDDWSGYLANISAESKTYLSSLLTVNSRAMLREWQDSVDETLGWGPLVAVVPIDVTLGLRLTADNAGSGNFTGGNATNRLTAITYYLLEAEP